MSPEGWTEREKLEALGRLSAGVAHDFNNLLQLIEVSAKELEERIGHEDRAKAELDTIVHSVDLAGSLVRSFLKVCRKGHVEPEALRVGEVIVGLRSLLDRWAPTGRNISYRLSSDTKVVTIPRIHLEQIILNLFLNAHKATQEGDTIVVQYAFPAGAGDGMDDHVRITVSDTGSGIEDAVRARIFEPFFTSDEGGGSSGLGLATVKDLVEGAGGRISVDSSPVRGSSFHVYLPAAEEPIRDDIRLRRHGRPATGSILVVEDERGTALRLQKVLARAGHRVHLASSTDAALRVAEQEHVDLVISDVEVPGPSVARFGRVLRAADPGVRFVLMSAHLEEVIESELDVDGFERVLTKPLDENELVAAVDEELIARGRLESRRLRDATVDLARAEAESQPHQSGSSLTGADLTLPDRTPR